MPESFKKLLTIAFFIILIEPVLYCQTWRFAVVGDTHVGSSDTIAEMVPYMLADNIDCIFIPGDLAEGGLAASGAELMAQLTKWQTLMKPLYDDGIGVYPIYGNHEDDARNNVNMWNAVFSGDYALPQNGPVGEENFTYSVSHKNALFIALDNYKNIHEVNQEWLDEQLASNGAPHVFVFGHEAAFKVFHADCLDDSLEARNAFWQSLTQAGVKTYFCGHDHFLDVARIDDGDGNEDNDLYQYLVGTGGGWLMNKYSNYNGENSHYSPKRMFHEMEYGYALVEVSGGTPTDNQVTITWKKRVWNTTTLANEYVATSNVIQYSVNTSITSIDSPDERTGALFPNPAAGFITLSGLKGQTIIYNLMGVEMWSGFIEGTQQIDVRAFPNGVYLLKNKHLATKFMVVNE